MVMLTRYVSVKAIWNKKKCLPVSHQHKQHRKRKEKGDKEETKLVMNFTRVLFSNLSVTK